jgi:hypothetical protein
VNGELEVLDRRRLLVEYPLDAARLDEHLRMVGNGR